MKYTYVVDSLEPYRSHVEDAESKLLVLTCAGGQILELIGDNGIPNREYEAFIKDNWLKADDILVSKAQP